MGLVDFSLSDIGSVFTSIREAITGEKIKDPAELAKIDLQLAQLQQAANSGQLKINEVEAASKSLFVAGWRPFIGWVCGVAIAYTFVIQPLLAWLLNIIITFGSFNLTPEEIKALQPITLDISQIMGLVLSMLGMAGLRTYEKKQKVAREK